MAMVMVKKAPAKKPAAKKPASKKASTVVEGCGVGIGALCGTGLALAMKPSVKKSPAKKTPAKRPIEKEWRIDIPLSITQTSE